MNNSLLIEQTIGSLPFFTFQHFLRLAMSISKSV